MKIVYQQIRMRSASLALVDICNRIIEEYTAAGYKLTLRQLYYHLLSRGVLKSNQKEYNRLTDIVNNGRMAGLIDWDLLEDRTRKVRSIAHFESPEEGLTALHQQYHIDKWLDQPVRPEVWVEKDALVGVIDGICKELDVACLSCRGYCSQSEMWAAAQRFAERAEYGQKTRVIYLGDHDPSGLDMSRDIKDRITTFMQYDGCEKDFSLERIAITKEQAEASGMPGIPIKLGRGSGEPGDSAKKGDARAKAYLKEHGALGWELDALPPDMLVGLARTAVSKLRDDELFTEAEEEETEQRALLEKVATRWENVCACLG